MKVKEVSEKELLKRIDIINDDSELEEIVNNIRNVCIKLGAYSVESRIKSKKTAIESFRINKKKAHVSMSSYKTIGMTNPSTVRSFECVDTVVDLLALRVITNNANDLYKIKDYLLENYKPFIVIDLINEPLVGFEYRAIHMYFKIKTNDLHFDIPMEIQLKTYEMHHAWAGLHDMIYKNNKINLKDGCTLLPILFKIFEFNVRVLKNELNNCKVKIDFTGIDCIINYNKKLFKKYDNTIKKACFIMAKSIYYDKNNNSNISENRLFEIFNNIIASNINRVESPLHLYGNRSVEYATYCIATNNF